MSPCVAFYLALFIPQYSTANTTLVAQSSLPAQATRPSPTKTRPPTLPSLAGVRQTTPDKIYYPSRSPPTRILSFPLSQLQAYRPDLHRTRNWLFDSKFLFILFPSFFCHRFSGQARYQAHPQGRHNCFFQVAESISQIPASFHIFQPRILARRLLVKVNFAGGLRSSHPIHSTAVHHPVCRPGTLPPVTGLPCLYPLPRREKKSLLSLLTDYCVDCIYPLVRFILLFFFSHAE